MPAKHFDNRKNVMGGGAHFKFYLNGQKYIYCYIRKNASTAMVNFITGISPYQVFLNEFSSRFEFIKHHHLVTHPDEFDDADYSFFVYRDPIERAKSLYINKFVDRYGHEGIFEDYKRITNKDPNKASFHDFVFEYLGERTSKKDPHTLAQYRHLANINYTDSIHIKNLTEDTKRLFGEQLATRFFEKRFNSSESTKKGWEIREPKKAPELTPTITNELEKIYEKDYAMIAKICSDIP